MTTDQVLRFAPSPNARRLAPLALVGLALAVSALAVVVGLLASREVFERTPLEAIREE
jgi:hypothetical protein